MDLANLQTGMRDKMNSQSSLVNQQFQSTEKFQLELMQKIEEIANKVNAK